MNFLPHYSVLNKESIDLVLEHLSTNKFLVLDGTFGAGGHSFALVQRDERVQVLAIDQDPDAIKNGKAWIKQSEFNDRIFLYHANFSEVAEVLSQFKSEHPGFDGLDGAVLDLGVSSHQFDKAERGFSFRNEAKLDMRMDYQNDELETAADVVNNYSSKQLQEIFQEYGEERFSRRIAEAIVEARSKQVINTTKELENIIFHCYPKKMRHGKTHPATRCFQALRIHVNRELQVLEMVIKELVKLLNEKGRIAIITFHSLEDRIVKHTFKNLAKESDKLHVITKKPVLPSEDEISENSRSRSAKLRVLERNSTYEGSKKKNFRKN